MSLKKTVAIVAAAGALAAISVPAMALENEFHGTYTFNGIFSNFQAGGSGDFYPAGMAQQNDAFGNKLVSAATAYKTERQMNNYFEQRARLQYIAKVSDDLKLVTHFELDTRFGSPAQAGGSNGVAVGKYTSTDAGKLDADGISLETKHVYLDFNLGNNFNVKTGIMPYKDTIKGLFIDADVPAVVTTTKLGAYTLGLGFSRFADDAALKITTAPASSTRLGDANKDLFIMDNIFAINKDTKAAFSYYLLADYAATTTGGATTVLDQHKQDQAILLNTFALSGETKVGPVSLSGFGAMQAGHMKKVATFAGAGLSPNTSGYFHGYAANVAAKAAVGPGTLKGAFLFTSGNNNEGSDAQSRGWVTSSVNSYNESGMMIIARNTANSPTSTDNYIRRNVTNIALLTMGYDANLGEKVYANANLGFGWVPASNGAPVDKSLPVYPGVKNNNSGDYMGTELNLETGYKVNANLTLRAQAAYMMLGSYYKNSADTASNPIGNPENPYTMRLLASFKF